MQGHRKKRSAVIFITVVLMDFAASIHLVWFYLSCVPSYLHLERFEQGLESSPFQYRLLMMFPLRWAHQSPTLSKIAQNLSGMTAWFPHGVRPEGLVEAPVDAICVITTGLVARSIYVKASRTGILTPYVYPLTLLMIACTYVLYTMHRLRFVYDFPSLALFSIGLYLIYFRRSKGLFVSVFLVATINRETTLFLLAFYLLVPPDDIGAGNKPSTWGRLLFSRLIVVAPLLAYWIGWHVWVVAHFRNNATQSWSRVWLNVGILLWPTSWVQILSAFAFCWPLVLLLRREVADQTLRLWQWVPSIWLVFMLRYGIFIEVRIFGELIPYVACMAALISEEYIVRSYQDHLDVLCERCARLSPAESSLIIPNRDYH
jgi:hypothetical protein